MDQNLKEKLEEFNMTSKFIVDGWHDTSSVGLYCSYCVFRAIDNLNNRSAINIDPSDIINQLELRRYNESPTSTQIEFVEIFKTIYTTEKAMYNTYSNRDEQRESYRDIVIEVLKGLPLEAKKRLHRELTAVSVPVIEVYEVIGKSAKTSGTCIKIKCTRTNFTIMRNNDMEYCSTLTRSPKRRKFYVFLTPEECAEILS